jgi:TPP-dependent pyruvate/acetoin dehydrogenase alpha subunit
VADPTPRAQPSAELERHARAYREMRRIRCFEERVAVLYRDGEIPGFVHLSIGQEGIAVGVCSTLRRTDFIASTHRGHGHCLAKGADMAAMFIELLGREGGTCRGRGGSMHIADPDLGILGANGIVGAGLPIAVGAAAAARQRGDDAVAVAFAGAVRAESRAGVATRRRRDRRCSAALGPLLNVFRWTVYNRRHMLRCPSREVP